MKLKKEFEISLFEMFKEDTLMKNMFPNGIVYEPPVNNQQLIIEQEAANQINKMKLKTFKTQTQADVDAVAQAGQVLGIGSIEEQKNIQEKFNKAQQKIRKNKQPQQQQQQINKATGKPI